MRYTLFLFNIFIYLYSSVIYLLYLFFIMIVNKIIIEKSKMSQIHFFLINFNMSSIFNNFIFMKNMTMLFNIKTLCQTF